MPNVIFQDGRPAELKYDIPLPQSHKGKRILKVELEIADIPWSQNAQDLGESIENLTPQQVESRNLANSAEALIAAGRMAAQVVPIVDTVSFQQFQKKAVVQPQGDQNIVNKFYSLFSGRNKSARLGINPIEKEQLLDELGLDRTKVYTFYQNWAGNFIPVARDPIAFEPSFLIVETYKISSFLGNYGLGKTVKTFSLLPGEETTIYLKTWKSESLKESTASSIIDSVTEKSKTAFQDKVQNESTDKQTQNSTESWHAEAEVKAGWGWGSAKVSGGGAGEYQNGRESFVKDVAETTKEHAQEASNERETSVSSSSERTVESGTESIIERTIKNINLRNTLNFVFRELNQEYITKTHLIDVKIAFTNGRLNSYTETPLTGLYQFVDNLVSDEAIRDEIIKNILNLLDVVFDKDGNPQPMLDLIEFDNQTKTFVLVQEGAIINDADYLPPTPTRFYKLKNGPIGQDGNGPIVQDENDPDVQEDDNQNEILGSPNPVDGVLVAEKNITMKTDSVLVESLLGEAVALDQYAIKSQEVELKEKQNNATFNEYINATINALPQNDKLDAIEKILNAKNTIEDE